MKFEEALDSASNSDVMIGYSLLLSNDFFCADTFSFRIRLCVCFAEALHRAEKDGSRRYEHIEKSRSVFQKGHQQLRLISFILLINWTVDPDARLSFFIIHVFTQLSNRRTATSRMLTSWRAALKTDLTKQRISTCLLSRRTHSTSLRAIDTATFSTRLESSTTSLVSSELKKRHSLCGLWLYW